MSTTTIFIENKPFEVNAERNVLEVCLSLGLNLPYFCWHPAMGSVGACRQCAVKQFRNEADIQGKLVMACMTPVSKDMRVSIEDPEARAFRAGIIEGLMQSHPHDCPVCDEGGECHLQDMTVMTGHDYRRYAFNKRTFQNQYLGPFLNHEMNRCIQCYRCVRFYRDYAGGRDFNAFALRNTVFFGRHEDGVLENEFAGNLVEVCPTGVFTDKTLKGHYTRKWDLQLAPSICVHCALGCNTSTAERYGLLRRIVNRFNGEINGYFLCDRGRYGYEFVNCDRRIRMPLLRQDGKLEPTTKADALEWLKTVLSGNKKVIGIGSPRASLESNFALRALVGPDRFFAGIPDDQFSLLSILLQILRSGPARSPSLREVQLSDAVLILGEDITNFAPRMALSLRQSVRRQPLEIARKLRIPLWDDNAVREAMQNEKGPLFIATPNATRLDDVATETYRAAPDDLARLGFEVAHALEASAPVVPDLADAAHSLAQRIAQALMAAHHPLIVSGPGCHSEPIIQAAANVARALCRQGHPAGLTFAAPECNSFGLALMEGGTLGGAFQAIRSGTADTVILLENDLYRRAPTDTVNAFLDAARHVIVLDHLATPSTAGAELVLPAGTFAESDGTLVSSEGRAQRFFQVLLPQGETQESWRWLRDALLTSGDSRGGSWQSLDDVVAAMATSLPVFQDIPHVAPSAEFRLAGAKIPRQPHRYSGRTAMLANISVHEPKPPDDPDSALSFSMEGYPDQPPPALIPFVWFPGWNSIQATNKYQTEVAGPLRGGDPGLRLIEPGQQGDGAYFSVVPPAFTPRPDEWLLVPLYHIFGSEELSSAAPAVTELAPRAYVALNPDDALGLQLTAGQNASVKLASTEYQLPVRIEHDLPRGVAGAPVGRAPLEGIQLPAWSKISQL